MRSTKSSVVIPKLDKIFAVHVIPFELTSNSGPPFNGDEFARYLKLLGMKCTPSTPIGYKVTRKFTVSWNH